MAWGRRAAGSAVADNLDMKRMNTVWALALIWMLTACGPRKPEPAATEETSQPKSGLQDLAAPVTAPMKARDHLRQQMRKQNAKAQDRRRQLDSVIDQNR